MTRPLLDERGQPVRIGPYTAEHQLGRGGMGSVFAARRDSDGARVALKVLIAGQLGSAREIAEERFQREVRAMRVLEHPNIVRILDAGQADTAHLGDVLYYAMELVDGVTLHELLRYGAVFPEEAAAIAVEIADALHYAHRRDIIHRDIKPANVFVTEDRRVLVGDFGIAKLTGLSTLTAAGVVLGTLQFLAPEQFLEQPVDARTDVFAVGAVTYTLVTGRYLRPQPSAAEILRVVREGADVERVRSLRELDPRLVEALARAVDPEPARRFESARALREALLPLAGRVPQPGSDRVGPNVTPTEPIGEPAALVHGGEGGGLTGNGPEESLGAALAGVRLFDTVPRSVVTGSRPLDPADLDAGDRARLMLVGRPSALEEPVPRVRPPRSRAKRAGVGLARRARPAASPGALRAALLAVAVAVAALAVLLALRLRPVAVVIESIPSGAAVFLDGEEVGLTPLRHKLPRRRDRLTLELRAADRDVYREELVLPVLGSPAPVVAAMPLRRARLDVATLPAGASVLVDGVARCTSPCRALELAPRERHLLRVERPGCVPRVRQLAPAPGEAVTWELGLEPLQARSLALLKIVAPRGPLRVDGVDVSQEMARGELLFFAGPHFVEWGSAPDIETRELTLTPGSTQVVVLRQPTWQPPAPPLFPLEEVEDPQRAPRLPTLAEYVDHAVWLLQAGKARVAMRYLERAIVLDPVEARVHRGYIAAAVAQGNDKLALGHMHHFLNAPEPAADAERVRRVSVAAAQPDPCPVEADATGTALTAP